MVEPRGRQRLRLDTVEIPFAADRLALTVPLEAGVPPRAGDLAAERLRLRAGEGAAVEVEQAGAHLETSSSATEGEPAIPGNQA